MERLNDSVWRVHGIVALAFASGSLCRADQTQQGPTQVAPSAQVGSSPLGLQSVDLISLHSYVGGIPLRHGNLIPGSEKIQLNGVTLVSGADYAMDFMAGVVYLKVAQTLGDSLVAYYNFDPKPGKPATSAINGFQYNILPGAALIMGMGLTDRSSDGQVVTSNLFGWKDGLSFGGKASLSGLMIVSNQQSPLSSNQYTEGAGQHPAGGFNEAPAAQDGHFLLQNYKSAVLGGSMAVDFQNISKNFAGFSQVGAAGYSNSDVQRFQAERGLDRTGIALNGLKFGGLAVSDSSRSVQDDRGQGISWKNVAVAQGGLKLTYFSQKVDDGFGRFNDLSEADKLQLLKERGMSRQNLAGEFAAKTGKFDMQSLSIKDDVMGQGVRRNDLRFDSSRYKAEFGQESVDANFLRAASLTAPEAAQYARETGTSRRWFTFAGAPDAKSKPFTFGEMDLSSPTGKFTERDLAFTGKSYNIQHIEVGGSASFASMAALQDSDATAYVQKLGLASGVTAATSAADKAAFLSTPTLRRDYTSATIDLSKVWRLRMDDLGLKGATDTGYATDATLTNGPLTAAFHKQMTGTNLAEVAGLMPIEQARLGALPGLQRQDYSFTDQISKNTKLMYGQLIADTSAGNADRTVLSYATKGFSVDASQRKVDTGFTAAGQLIDPEAAVLASLAGFSQRDLKMTWNKLPNMAFTGEAQDARDAATGEFKSLSTYKFNWNLNKTAQIGISDTETVDKTPTSNILSTGTRQLTFSKDFGKYGKFAFLDEQDLDSGVSALLPSSHKDYLSYESKLTAKTSFKVEQTVTTFRGGGTQGITSETVSAQLTKRLGISVTQAEIVGNAQQPAPAKTNYGIWYDLGNGVRVSYGYAYQYNDGSGSVATSGLSLGKNPGGQGSTAPTSPPGATPPAAPPASSPVAPAPSAPAPSPPPPGAPPAPPSGILGPFTFTGGVGSTSYAGGPAGSAGHTSAFDNIAFSTVKPFNIGPLRNMKFALGMDTASDYGTWSKNNRNADLSGSLGSNNFDFLYKGQLAALGGEGIDRGFRLTTSNSPHAWIQASLLYKERTLPGETDYLIRDYTITARPIRNLEISNQLQTNPEVVNSAVFLGSAPQAARSDKWTVAYHQGKDTTFGAAYQELVNVASNVRTTTTGMTLKMFEKSGSPVSLFYGYEDDLGGIVPHRVMNRYSFQFDQKAGPRQTLSLFLGNLSYDYNSPENVGRQNWTVRCDYQLRF